MTKPTEKIGVMIATPMRHYTGLGNLHPHFQAQLAKLTAWSEDPDFPYEFQLCIMEGGLCRARNKIVGEFRKQRKANPNLKWLLTWDDDNTATAEHALALLSHKKPLVGALYTTREKEGHWVANFMHEVELQFGGLLQVIEVGTGFKLHHFQVFDELERIFPMLSYTDRDSGERDVGFYQHCVLQTDLRPDGDLLTEDFFFDHLCRMAKIGIFVDTNIKIKHRGGDGTLYPDVWPPIPGIE